MEARHQDGACYPPNSLYGIVTGIQRYLREGGRHEISFLSTSDPTFGRLRQVLDAHMKELTAAGVGSVRKRAEPLSKQQEQLWDTGVFNLDCAQGLTYLVFFYNCKLFGLRGGDEHRELCCEQFTVSFDDTGRFIRFVGRASKNVKGGLKQKYVSTKDLKIYARPELGERYIVDIYNHYFGFIALTCPFYRKPAGNHPPNFASQVIGRNKLGGLMKEMCQKAGLEGNFTNHSDKVTCASRLFENNVSEQLIMRQTGHRSNAVRAYKHCTSDHDMMVSKILHPPSPKKPKESPAADISCQSNTEKENEDPFSTLKKKGVSMTFNFNF